ncbi:MAG: YHS domain-containing protein [Candidatus Brocadiaceae bacterium]|nr:YHS domain-containing protein [Candidatus Brocadiaceae bacterium]
MKSIFRTLGIGIVVTGLSFICVNKSVRANCGVCGSGGVDRSGGPIVHKEKKHEHEKDPICDKEIHDTKNAPSGEFQGKTYYFCSEECKKIFNERIGHK